MTRSSGKSGSGSRGKTPSRDWREQYRDWTGSADDLVDLVGRLMRAGVAPDPDSTPNVRLLRHYVSVGAVSRPERVGREAHFGFRHLVEYFVVRVLLADGWPLAKIAELVGRASLEALLEYFTDHPAPPKASAPDLHATALRSVRLDAPAGADRREVVRVEVEPGLVLELDSGTLAGLPDREIASLSKRVRRALEREQRRRGGRE